MDTFPLKFTRKITEKVSGEKINSHKYFDRPKTKIITTIGGNYATKL